LSLIIVGVGFLKANISSLVGELYETGDKRRDSGFTFVFTWNQLRFILATLICVWLGENTAGVMVWCS
jgi:POT family proton-dependent oligopeptide transporter